MAPFDYTAAQQRSGLLLLRLRGHMKCCNELAQMRQMVRSAVEHHACLVVLDMTELLSIDSYALGFLAILHAELESEGGRLTAVRPNAEVAYLLESTKMNELIPVCAELSDVKALAKPAA
jgi:anti-anti-sigma factor